MVSPAKDNLTVEAVKKSLARYASDYDAINLQRFFKTGVGEYGEGDVFIGVRMGPIRQVAKDYQSLPLSELKKLVISPVHEHRMLALVIASSQYKKSDPVAAQKLYDFYIWALSKGYINNWDLVDVTCEHIVGAYLESRPRNVLYNLADSNNLWERRVAIISTFRFIKKGDYLDCLNIADKLINDEQDLIHKATGWMLREVGKRIDEQILCSYLDKNAYKMPRTMLRYSIEKLAEPKRQKYLKTKEAIWIKN